MENSTIVSKSESERTRRGEQNKTEPEKTNCRVKPREEEYQGKKREGCFRGHYGNQKQSLQKQELCERYERQARLKQSLPLFTATLLSVVNRGEVKERVRASRR